MAIKADIQHLWKLSHTTLMHCYDTPHWIYCSQNKANHYEV